MHQPPLQVAIRQINGRASLSVLEFNAAWSARWSKPSEGPRPCVISKFNELFSSTSGYHSL